MTVDGKPSRVVGLDGPTPNGTFLWIPSERAVVGGTNVAAKEHVVVADTQSPQRGRALFTLDRALFHWRSRA